MPLTAAEFREAVRNSTGHTNLTRLVETEILDRDPHAFESDLDLYERVRTHLSKSLGAEPDAVGLVGSGAMGFSVAPDNFSRPFHEGSDLDFVVISPALFDAAWNVLLRWGHPVRHHVPEEAQNWFDERSGEIFWGWMDPERLRFRGATKPALLRDLKNLKSTWFETFQSLGVAFPNSELSTRKVSARLYRSRMHLIHYQANGLSRVWYNMNKGQR